MTRREERQRAEEDRERRNRKLQESGRGGDRKLGCLFRNKFKLQKAEKEQNNLKEKRFEGKQLEKKDEGLIRTKKTQFKYSRLIWIKFLKNLIAFRRYLYVIDLVAL